MKVKSIKKLLECALIVANTEIKGLSGSKRLNDWEYKRLVELSGIVSNELDDDMIEILTKFHIDQYTIENT